MLRPAKPILVLQLSNKLRRRKAIGNSNGQQAMGNRQKAINKIMISLLKANYNDPEGIRPY